jgi:hypothetical protein
MYRGTTMAAIIRDEAVHDPKRGFMGGYEMETLWLGLPFMAAFLNPGGWGRTFTFAMENDPRMAGMWLVGEHAAGNKSRDARFDDQGQARDAGRERALRRSSQRRRHAQPRLQWDAAICEAVGATASIRPRPIRARTTWAPTA